MIAGMTRDAQLSRGGLYRWTLTRTWDDRPRLLVCMFNPSTANHLEDDPTISLVCHIAAFNGYGGITVVNLCPLRSSKPEPAIAMLKSAQCVEDTDWAARRILWQNVRVIAKEFDRAGAVLLAWGAMGAHAGDWYTTVMQELRERRPVRPIYRLGVCANGHPKHPLARGKHKVHKDAALLLWTP